MSGRKLSLYFQGEIMIDAKNSFILHHEYKHFTPGTSELVFDTLIPYENEVKKEGGWWAVIGLFLILLLPFVMSLFFIYNTLIIPLLFERFSTETTGQVVDCRIAERKIGDVPIITYAYTWNNRAYRGSSDIVGAGTSDCSAYQNQTLTIIVLSVDPARSFPKIAQTPYFHSQESALLAGSLFLAFASLLFAFQFLQTVLIYRRVGRIFPRLKNGTLLPGKILKVSGYRTKNIIGYRPRVYVVTVTYEFETPSKRRLTGRAQAIRPELKDDFPPVGTPVSVLYADDHAHMML
jgi:hypothetical protein